MSADWAHFGGFLADYDMAAVGALPNAIAIARELLLKYCSKVSSLV